MHETWRPLGALQGAQGAEPAMRETLLKNEIRMQASLFDIYGCLTVCLFIVIMN